MVAPEYIGAVVVAVLAGLIKSAANGRLREAIKHYRRKRMSEDNAHEKIPEVVDRLETIDNKQDRTFSKVTDVQRRVDEIGRTVVLLHAEDDHVDNSVLRDRVGVDETDDDLFTRGGTDLDGE